MLPLAVAPDSMVEIVFAAIVAAALGWQAYQLRASREQAERFVDAKIKKVEDALAASMKAQDTINSRLMARLDHFEARQEEYEKLRREDQDKLHRQEVRYHAVISELKTEVMGKLAKIETLGVLVDGAAHAAKRAHDKANELQAALLEKALGGGESAAKEVARDA